MLRVSFLLPLSILAAACGGTTLDIADGSPDASSDASSDSPKSDDGGIEAGPLACGKLICQDTEYCIHPCCGGAAPQCLPVLDGGGCPPGSSQGQCFGPNGLQLGCTTQCTPDPPFCSPKREACPSGGGIPSGRNVSCMCA